TDADDDIAALTNAASGVIAAYAEGDTSASAYGITAGSLSGSASLVNDGSIQAVAVNHFESSAYAYGISTGELTGTASIANNGKIMVGAFNSAQTGDDSAYAYGIQSYIVDAGTSITNAGVIRVQAAADQGSASAYGIRTNAMSGTIENSGTIDVAASSVAEAAYAYGIYAGGTDPYATSVAAAGSIVNTGTINGAVYAGANYFYNCFSGCGYLGSSNINVTNSGSIKTFAEADSYVSGNYTQQAGGSLGFVLRNVDDYGQLYVSGTADFTASNTVKLHVDPKAVFANGDVLNDIIYANTLTAHADGFAVSDDALFWNFQVTEDAYGFDVTVKAVDPDSVLASAGMTLTDSQSSLLSGLLSGQAPASFDPLLAALNGADSASEAAKIVESFGPALAGAAGYATRVAGAGASNAISARMGETRGAASGDAFTKNAVWIKPFLGMASQDDTNGLSGYDVDTTGFVIGIDGDLNDNTRVGVAVASAQSDLEGGGVNLDIDTTQFTLYGSYALGAATSLDVDLSYGANGYDSRRRVSFAGSTAVADYDGTQLALGAAFSHRIAMSDKAALVPSLSVRYSKVELDGYSETGAAPFNLTVADSDDDAILALAKAGYELTLNNKGVFLANLGLGYDTVDQASATATVTSVGQTFVANGIEPDSTLIVGGIGYRYVTAKNLEINAAYDLESRSDFLGQTVSVKFRLPF
ncbi:MAG TPA: autotransporter outer membrane beta-barrel domain-containing protein, partial [Moraxellaceae bacterium]|nr:autotransporter outer membrane beta-barrel domain-containing protein [Moraxellaceae bacterium]